MFFFPNKPIQIYSIEKLIPMLGDFWVTQPKWNGKRIEISCDEKLTLFSRERRQWFLKEWDWLSELPLPKPWFIDGELLRDGRIYVWDYALIDGTQMFRSPYGPRLEQLQKALPQPLTHNGTTLECIESMPVTSYKEFLARQKDPMLEGIVWKNLKATDSWGPYSTTKVSSQFKFRFADK
jgi:ATP-dependent DNA ligase